MKDESTLAFCLLLTMLVPFALAGLALINSGLNRTRSAAHSVLSSVCVAAVAVLAYGASGTAIFGAGHPGHLLLIAGKPWDWMGAAPLFARGLTFDVINKDSLTLLYQLFAVSLTCLIPLGSGAERWRLAAICLSTAAMAGFVYPLFSHWAWGNGWLAQLGTNFGLGHGFVDAGGAGVVQLTGGFAALVTAWLVGPRLGKFTPDGIPTAMPGHNGVLVLFGSLLAFTGWSGLSAAGAMLFQGASPGGALLAILNTLLAASGGAMASLLTTRARFGKPDASLTANGWVAALVASSAGAPFFNPSIAILVGIVAGVLAVFAIEVIEMRMRIDDPAGAISVHAVGGLWGLLSVGMFVDFGTPGQFLAQLLGVGTLLGFILPLIYGLNVLINHFVPYRVEPGGERQGMDLFELGAGAYPEFVTHREDFTRR